MCMECRWGWEWNADENVNWHGLQMGMQVGVECRWEWYADENVNAWNAGGDRNGMQMRMQLGMEHRWERNAVENVNRCGM